MERTAASARQNFWRVRTGSFLFQPPFIDPTHSKFLGPVLVEKVGNSNALHSATW
jgi:hypothetical protein